MNDRIPGIAARHAADMVSRRGSLRALGGVALAGALGGPTAASAGKAGKNANARCKRQREQCRRYFAESCGGSEACETAYVPCCEHFARCNAGTAIECIFAVEK